MTSLPHKYVGAMAVNINLSAAQSEEFLVHLDKLLFKVSTNTDIENEKDTALDYLISTASFLCADIVSLLGIYGSNQCLLRCQSNSCSLLYALEQYRTRFEKPCAHNPPRRQSTNY